VLTNKESGLEMLKPTLVFEGAQSRRLDTPLGISVVVTPLEKAQNTIRYRIALTVTLPTVQQNQIALSSRPLELTTNLSNGSALVVAGALPHRPPLLDEEHVYRQSFFTLFTDEDFVTGETEAVLVIQPQLYTAKEP